MQFGLHNKLFIILDEKNSIINRLIWRILGSLASSTDYHTQMLIDEDIAIYINKYLSQNFSDYDFSILRDIIWVCSNICLGTIKQINYLCENNVLKNIINLNKIFVEMNFEEQENLDDQEKKDILKVNIKFHKKCFRECVFTISSAINGSIIENRMNLIKSTENDICWLLIQSMNIFLYEEDLILNCLKTIKLILYLDEYMMEVDNVDNLNLFKEKILKYNIETILYFYVNTNMRDLYDLVSYLLVELNLE